MREQQRHLGRRIAIAYPSVTVLIIRFQSILDVPLLAGAKGMLFIPLRQIVKDLNDTPWPPHHHPKTGEST